MKLFKRCISLVLAAVLLLSLLASTACSSGEDELVLDAINEMENYYEEMFEGNKNLLDSTGYL